MDWEEELFEINQFLELLLETKDYYGNVLVFNDGKEMEASVILHNLILSVEQDFIRKNATTILKNVETKLIKRKLEIRDKAIKLVNSFDVAFKDVKEQPKS